MPVLQGYEAETWLEGSPPIKMHLRRRIMTLAYCNVEPNDLFFLMASYRLMPMYTYTWLAGNRYRLKAKLGCIVKSPVKQAQHLVLTQECRNHILLFKILLRSLHHLSDPNFIYATWFRNAHDIARGSTLSRNRQSPIISPSLRTSGSEDISQLSYVSSSQ
jgi:hypothetical protein